MNSHHHHHHKHGRNNGGGGKTWRSPTTVATASVMGVCIIAGYLIGPPLYWLLSDAAATSCPLCLCDCTLKPLLSHQNGLLNATSFIDCMEHDQTEVREGAERNFTRQLVEELHKREGEVHEIQQKAEQALLEAKKLTSQYQKEAEKCTSGMETCEEAREKAEAVLEAQREVSSMWELRARQKGWKESHLAANIQNFKAALEGEHSVTMAVTDL
ncbi:unnamed protein product [Cuscuta epithymum]|uniref:Uncharacterized protein n=1 Tax=Cuscuta epithymum TaxID=186058 RepID=A0AAV0F5I4_9ASTE|nr:unnamed protein product [Cuscuta epithymum]CAH9130806.1 unnamed protein product [Cuscuta epithymum]